jgi:hypothetical protein
MFKMGDGDGSNACGPTGSIVIKESSEQC